MNTKRERDSTIRKQSRSSWLSNATKTEIDKIPASKHNDFLGMHLKKERVKVQ